MIAHYKQQRRLFDGSRRRRVQQHSNPPPQHLFCPQPHYGGRLWESGASDADEPGTRRRCARRESHGGSTDSAAPVVSLGILAALASSSAIAYIPTFQPFPPHRRSTVAAAVAPTTIYQCRLRHTAVAAAAPAMIFRGPRRSTTGATSATVPTTVRSSSTNAAPMVAWSAVRHLRSSSQPPVPSVALAGTRGTLAAMDRR